MIRFQFTPIFAIPYGSFFPLHSTKIINKIRIRLFNARLRPENKGISKIEYEQIPEIKFIASSTFSDLKNTQAITVSRKVDPIWVSSLKVGSIFSSATTPRFILLRFSKSNGKMYNAFKPPHTINVQLAPCQKPLTKKIIKVFRTFIQVPPLLPPKGIYK